MGNLGVAGPPLGGVVDEFGQRVDGEELPWVPGQLVLLLGEVVLLHVQSLISGLEKLSCIHLAERLLASTG